MFFQNSHRGPSIPPSILLNYHLSTFSHHSEIKVSRHPGFNVRILRSSAPLEIAEYEKWGGSWGRRRCEDLDAGGTLAGKYSHRCLSNGFKRLFTYLRFARRRTFNNPKPRKGRCILYNLNQMVHSNEYCLSKNARLRNSEKIRREFLLINTRQNWSAH